MRETSLNNEPWYRNPWVWLIIAIPALTIAGCALTIYLAVTHPETLVTEAPAEVTKTLAQPDSARPG